MKTNADMFRKIGLNRGKKRLWLEGKVLSQAGFNRGDHWELTICDSGSLIVSKVAEGKRKIAGTDARPIIDINSSQTLWAFDDFCQISAFNDDGRIYLHISPCDSLEG